MSRSRMKQRDSGVSVIKVYGDVSEFVDIKAEEQVHLSRITTRTRNAVIRALENGITEHSWGKAAALHKYLTQHFEIPHGSMYAYLNSSNNTLAWDCQVTAPHSNQRDELQAFIAITLDGQKSYHERQYGPSSTFFSLSGHARAEVGDTHPREVFSVAFNSAYGDIIEPRRQQAIKALMEGETLTKTVEV